MTQINKKLRSVVETTSPEKMKELAVHCRASAASLLKTSEFLVEASRDFDNGAFAEGCNSIKKAENMIAQS